jgi:hypothetical protein
MYKLVVEFVELGGEGALAGEEQGVGHFAKDEAEGEGWGGEEGGAMHGFGQDSSESSVGHGLRGDYVESTGDVGVLDRKAENGRYIVEGDPT